MSKRAVRVVAIVAMSALIPAARAVAMPPTPPPPVNVMASSITSTSLVLSWSAVASASSYDVYARSYQSGSYQSNTSTTTFTFTGLTPCTTYAVGVRSRRGKAVSAWVTQSATTAGCVAPPPAAGLHVVGSELQDANGNVVRLHGVDRSGTEYACEQGWGFSDGPAGDTEMAAIASWTGVNNVAILLNEDCWLGINGVKSQYGGQNYINFIQSEVTAAEAHNLYPVIAFMWGAPGTTLATGHPDVPDNDHAPLFWQQVATTFKDDSKVIFRLQEEPHPNIGGYSTLADWKCWNAGDVQYDTSNALVPISQNQHCSESYKVVGFQSLLNIVRGTGATNVVQAPGLGWANLMACSTTGNPNTCGFLDSTDGVRLNDPLSSPQLMGDVDVYPDSNSCGNTTCYADTYAPVAAVMPFGAGETGPGSSTTGVDTFLSWMDQHGSSYDAWAWDTWAGLISNYNGTPASPWGTDYKAHVAALP